ncbi:unnamed protein product [Prunus armeniaca]
MDGCGMINVYNLRKLVHRWTKPNIGCLKMNVDGAWQPGSSEGGIGIVVRNEDGTGRSVIGGGKGFA